MEPSEANGKKAVDTAWIAETANAAYETSTRERDYGKERSKSRDRRSRSRSRERRRRRSRSSSRDYYRRRRSRSSSGSYERRRSPKRRRSYSKSPIRDSNASAKLVITQLPNDIEKESLTILFAKQGFVPTDVRIIHKADKGSTRSFGFVDFVDKETAQSWMERNQGTLTLPDGRRVAVEYARNGDAMKFEPDWICAKCTMSNFTRRDTCFKCDTSKEESLSLERRGFGDIGVSPTDTLLLRDLPDGANEMRILEVLRRATGDQIAIVNVKTSTSGLYAYVQLRSTEEAALLLNSFNKAPLQINGQIDSAAEVAQNALMKAQLMRQITEGVQGTHQPGQVIGIPVMGTQPIVQGGMMPMNAISGSAPQGPPPGFAPIIPNSGFAAQPPMVQLQPGVQQVAGLPGSFGQQAFPLDPTRSYPINMHPVAIAQPRDPHLTAIEEQARRLQAQINAMQAQQAALLGGNVAGTQSVQSATTSRTSGEMKNGVTGSVNTPIGVMLQYVIPDPTKFVHEPTTGYMHDSITNFYYDPKSTYYFNSATNKWTFFDPTFKTYFPVDQKSIITEAHKATMNSGSSSTSMKADTQKTPAEIAKEMAKWAKKQEKNVKVQMSLKPVVKPLEKKSVFSGGVSSHSATQDLTYRILEKSKNPLASANDSDSEEEPFPSVSSSLLSHSMRDNREQIQHKPLPSAAEQREAMERALIDRTNLEAKRVEWGKEYVARMLAQSQGKTDLGLNDSSSLSRTEDQLKRDSDIAASAPINASNIGNKLLKSMGWQEGMGVGRNLQGIVNPVEADRRVEGAGLGSSGSKITSGANASHKERTRAALFARYK